MTDVYCPQFLTGFIFTFPITAPQRAPLLWELHIYGKEAVAVFELKIYQDTTVPEPAFPSAFLLLAVIPSTNLV